MSILTKNKVYNIFMFNSSGICFLETQQEILFNELKEYNNDILNKKIIVVFNKIDLIDKKELEKKINNFKRTTKITPLCISTLTQEGLKDLVKTMFFSLKYES